MATRKKTTESRQTAKYFFFLQSPGNRANQLIFLSWGETNGCTILPIKDMAPIHTKII